MDRRPLAPARALAVLGLALGLGQSGCSTDTFGRGIFDRPDAAVVLDPLDGGPFDDPVAFVASTGNGVITPLDLKHGTVLADQLGGPFLTPRTIATGDMRQLGQLAVWAPDEERVTLFAADLSNDVLVEAPYVIGLDGGEPIPSVLESSEPAFVDTDGSGDSATLGDITLRHGWTTTEDWTISFDGDVWWVEGSRSGKQVQTAETGKDYRSDRRELSFKIEGSASSGDVFTLHTDTGLLEYPLGGPVLGLSNIPGEALLVAGVWDAAAETGDVQVFDPELGSVIGRVALPEGAQPWRFAFGADSTDLFVADAQRPAVYRVALDLADPSASTYEEIETDGTVAAIAYVASEGNPDLAEPAYAHLVVGLASQTRLDTLDLLTGAWLDPNPLDGEPQGIDVRSPIIGLSTAPEPIRLQERNNAGVRKDDYIVMLTTFDGAVRMVEGASGCLAIDSQGARLATSQGVEVVKFTDRGDASNPTMYTDPDTLRSVIFADCGGLVRPETWTLTFDGALGNWRVEGSVSGDQLGRAWEDQRYVTDQGTVSFLLLAGTSPTTDGDTIRFAVGDGVLVINSITSADGQSTAPFELPANPVAFPMRTGPTGGGWDAYQVEMYALVPITESDLAVRIRMEAWKAEILWN